MKSINKTIGDLRKDYNKSELLESFCMETPFQQFELWMEEALQSGVDEPHAMNLATVDENHAPSSRIVLLRNVDKDGFVFFTNYTSKKGSSLNARRPAALNFFWPDVQRQIRIEGICERVSEKVSDEYFNSRPFESKIGAYASQQSVRVSSREELDRLYDELLKQNEDKSVKRPDYWGGYRLIPNYFEFWQGRMSRLHDRIEYVIEDGQWNFYRLFP